MFGYVTPDKPNMYMKDYYLFRAYYCGLCINSKKCTGNCMRLAVNYDVTFINILIDGILGNNPVIKRKVCILSPFKKKGVVERTAIGNYMAYLNVLLAEFKLKDDKKDKNLGLGKRLAYPLVKSKARKARKELPDIARLVDECFTEQQEAEQNIVSIDRICHPFAKMIAKVGVSFLGNKDGNDIYEMLYNLGKWVYLIDAVDDFDDDKKRGNCNVFAVLYPQCKCKTELMEEHKTEVVSFLDTQLKLISKSYESIAMPSNEGVVTNTLWFGLEARQEQIIDGSKKCHTKIRL